MEVIIQSILNRQYKVYKTDQITDEIIIVVDGPIESPTKSVLDEIKDDRIFRIIYQNKNLGPGVSRSNGIKASNYEIIALMDLMISL